MFENISAQIVLREKSYKLIFLMILRLYPKITISMDRVKKVKRDTLIFMMKISILI